jgi:hypothetical protein
VRVYYIYRYRVLGYCDLYATDTSQLSLCDGAVALPGRAGRSLRSGDDAHASVTIVHHRLMLCQYKALSHHMSRLFVYQVTLSSPHCVSRIMNMELVTADLDGGGDARIFPQVRTQCFHTMRCITYICTSLSGQHTGSYVCRVDGQHRGLRKR